MKRRNSSPFIFVHGMFGWGDLTGINKTVPYWGASTGSLLDFLRKCDYECYAASVGPISSAWDNACELYAQLTGTRVDYGKAHSKKRNHDRYGRKYEKPLFDGFGERSVHLIGHSHGGQVVRLLAHLLTYGDEEERKSTDEKDISPLFVGGNEKLIVSVTTLCSPNNGTLLFKLSEEKNLIHTMGRGTNFGVSLLGRTPLHGKLVDCQMEQFGLTPLKGEKKADKILTAVNRVRDSDDHILRDLSFSGAIELNEKIEISKNIYYFCYYASGAPGEEFSTRYMKFPLLKVFGKLIATISFPSDDEYGITFGEEWHENDGLVNVPSAKNPFDEPGKNFDGTPEKGVWNIMPAIKGDHGQTVGLMADKNKTRGFFLNLLNMLTHTEKETCLKENT